MHKFIDTINPEIRSKEKIGDKIRVREFYHMRPEEMYLRISREKENFLIRTREKIKSLEDRKEEKRINKSEIKDYENYYR